MGSHSRHAFEVRETIERHIYLAGRSAIFKAVDVFEEIGGKLVGFDELVEGESGIDTGGNRFGVDFVAVSEDDSFGLAIFDDDFGDGGLGANLDSGLAGGVGDGV